MEERDVMRKLDDGYRPGPDELRDWQRSFGNYFLIRLVGNFRRSPSVRIEAIGVLLETPGLHLDYSSMSHLFRAALEDVHETVRTWARYLIAKLQSEHSIKILAPAVDYYDFDDPKIHREAVRCLREIARAGGRWAKDCLARMRGDARFSSTVRVLAHNAIESLKFPPNTIWPLESMEPPEGELWLVSHGGECLRFKDQEGTYTAVFTTKERAEAALREAGLPGTPFSLQGPCDSLKENEQEMIMVDPDLGSQLESQEAMS